MAVGLSRRFRRPPSRAGRLPLSRGFLANGNVRRGTPLADFASRLTNARSQAISPTLRLERDFVERRRGASLPLRKSIGDVFRRTSTMIDGAGSFGHAGRNGVRLCGDAIWRGISWSTVRQTTRARPRGGVSAAPRRFGSRRGERSWFAEEQRGRCTCRRRLTLGLAEHDPPAPVRRDRQLKTCDAARGDRHIDGRAVVDRCASGAGVARVAERQRVRACERRRPTRGRGLRNWRDDHRRRRGELRPGRRRAAVRFHGRRRDTSPDRRASRTRTWRPSWRHAFAAVGTNTKAMIEAGIDGKNATTARQSRASPRRRRWNCQRDMQVSITCSSS